MYIKHIDKQAIEEYLNNPNITIKELAEKYDCAVSTMSKFLKSNNVKIRTNVAELRAKNDRKKYSKDYKAGMSVGEIAKKYGVCTHTIRRNLKMDNIYKEPEYMNYKHNYSYFENIDNEHKAYWLGFIFADGCIRTDNGQHNLTIELNRIDLLHLRKFRDCIEANVPITTRKNRQQMCAIKISSIKTIEDLAKYGCIPNKTFDGVFTDKILNLDTDLKKAFLRGYLDGDGFIDKKRYRIIYTVKQLKVAEQLVDLIYEVCGIKARIRKEKTYYRVNIESKKGTMDFLNSVYENATMFLNRKYEIYLAKQPSQAETPEKISAELSGELLTDLYKSTDTIIC